MHERYVELRKIGDGSFGYCKLGIDTQLGRAVAIKYIKILSRRHGSPVQLPTAIFREIEALRQLSCDNSLINSIHVVQLFDVFAEENRVCLVMEFMPSDLSVVIAQSLGHLAPGAIKGYTQMMIQALSYCHSKSVVHRDVKPSSSFTVDCSNFILCCHFNRSANIIKWSC